MNEETKRRALALMDEEWVSFDASFRQLTPAQLEQPVFGEGEGWRVRDIPAHLALWQWVSTQIARKVKERSQLPDTPDWDIWAGIDTPTDQLNDESFRKWRGRSVEDALKHLAEVHRELMAAIEDLAPEQIASGPTLPDDMQPYVRAPGVRHVRNHRKHIETALREATTL